jgi:hypothetical protein
VNIDPDKLKFIPIHAASENGSLADKKKPAAV